jgi:2-C-methyl-D-erythritol 4-phosphate cytidylyltransferase
LPRDVGVIVVAAGRGVRFGGSVPKQYCELAGVPMLLRALRPFASHPEVAHVVVVLPAADAVKPPGFLADLTGGNLSIVAGGAERRDSVAQGLAAVPAGCSVILVHDAARPLVDRAIIDGVIAAARGGVGAVPAIPIGDTVKEAGGTEAGAPRVLRTVPREHLWLAQTPQGFPRALLEAAHARAHTGGAQPTDDAMLLEQMGAPVVLVPGSRQNLKVTTDADLLLAERML